MNAIRILALVLAAAFVGPGTPAASSESPTGGHGSHAEGFGEHRSYAEMHATISQSALGHADKDTLHEIVGDIADIEMSARQADTLRRDYDLETNSERKLAIKNEIEKQETLYDSAQADASAKLGNWSAQVTQVGDTISNLISQVNSMINNAVRE